jgi:hypothetical protein
MGCRAKVVVVVVCLPIPEYLHTSLDSLCILFFYSSKKQTTTTTTQGFSPYSIRVCEGGGIQNRPPP